MRHDPLPTNIRTEVVPPVDMSDANMVFQYTDDLVRIHDQLVTYFTAREKLNTAAETLCARVRQAFQEYFNGDLLECWHDAKSKEAENDLIISAHTRVIILFHALWGVLPSRDLDDYRVLAVEAYSLSEDFLDEALCGIQATSDVHIIEALGMKRVKTDVHMSKGEFTYPIWVGPIKLCYELFEGQVGSMNDEGQIFLDCLGPFEGGRNAMHEGAWVIGNTVYVNAERLGIEGPGWKNVVGMTKQEIEESYAKRTNPDE